MPLEKYTEGEHTTTLAPEFMNPARERRDRDREVDWPAFEGPPSGTKQPTTDRQSFAWFERVLSHWLDSQRHPFWLLSGRLRDDAHEPLTPLGLPEAQLSECISVFAGLSRSQAASYSVGGISPIGSSK